jgi:hypothetical protein
MSKLIPMDQAAKMLGMTIEKLNELRSNQEIFGYRDGANWKFKRSELERVADEIGVTLSDDGGGEGIIGAAAGAVGGLLDGAKDKAKDVAEDLGIDFGDSEELILDDSDSVSGESESFDLEEDSSIELFQKPLQSASDVLATDDDELLTLEDSGLLKPGTSKESVMEDGEISLASGDSFKLDDSGSFKIDESGSFKIGDSGSLKLDGSGSLKLDDSSAADMSESAVTDEDELSFGTSDISLASESSKKLTGSETGSDVLDESLEKKESSSDTGKMNGGGEDDLMMAEEDLFDDDLVLQDSASFEDSSDLSSDFDESDLVLDDSDSSSDLVLEANKSGIALSANDSGILVGDEPLELGGSDIDNLELPEDDDMIVLEDAADADSATLMQEDDFNLTPLEQSMDDDDSSGSQVIALEEDSEIYADDSAATVLGESGDFDAQPAMLDDTSGLVGGQYGEPALIGAPGTVMAQPEAPYTLMNVLALGLTTLLLFLGAMIAYDAARNMWMPEQQVISSGFLNFMLEQLGMKG